MAILNKVVKIIHEITNRAISQRITVLHSLDELGIDKEMLLDLVWKLEDDFLIDLEGCKLFEEELTEITVGQIIQHLEEI